MIRCTLIVVALTLMAASAGTCAPPNVAQGKTVTVSGAVSGAALSTAVDGIFLPENRQWQTGTVWWNGLTPHLEIDLGGLFTISSMTVQADNNDTYVVKYLNGSGGWDVAWNVPYRYNGGGMSTRPNPGEVFTLASPITTSKLWFAATGGDNMYSVSEIQAFGESPAVPEVSSLALALCGLPSLTMLRRLRRRA